MKNFRVCLISVLVYRLLLVSAYAGLNYPLLSANQILQSNAILTMPRTAETVAYNPAGMMMLKKGEHVSLNGVLAAFQLDWEGSFGGDGTREQAYKSEGRHQSASTNAPVLPGPLLQYANVKEGKGWGVALKVPFVAPIHWDKQWAGKDLIQSLDLLVFGVNFNYAFQIKQNHYMALGLTPHLAYINYRRDGILLDGNNPLVVGAVDDYVNELLLGIPGSIGFDTTDLIDTILEVFIPNPLKVNDKIELSGIGRGLSKNISYLGKFDHIFVAANYITTIPISIEGEAFFGLNPAAAGLLYTGDQALKILGLPTLELTLEDQPVTIDIDLPWNFDLALGWKDDVDHPIYELEIGYSVAGFSVMDEMGADLSKPSNVLKIAGFDREQVRLTFKFKDTYSYRAGGLYHISEKYIVKGGIERTTSLTGSRYLSPIAPIGAMWALAGGGEYALSENESISAGLGAFILDKASTSKSEQHGVFQENFQGTYGGLIQFALINYSYMINNTCKCL